MSVVGEGDACCLSADFSQHEVSLQGLIFLIAALHPPGVCSVAP